MQNQNIFSDNDNDQADMAKLLDNLKNLEWSMSFTCQNQIHNQEELKINVEGTNNIQITGSDKFGKWIKIGTLVNFQLSLVKNYFDKLEQDPILYEAVFNSKEKLFVGKWYLKDYEDLKDDINFSGQWNLQLVRDD